MKWTVGTKIGAGFALALAAIIVIGTVSYRGLSKIKEATDLRAHSHQLLEEVKDLIIQVTSAEARQRNYIITGEVSYRDGSQAAAAATREELGNLKTLTKEDTKQQERVRQLEPLIESRLAVLSQGIELRKDEAKGFEAALELIRTGTGPKLMAQVQQIIADMENEEFDQLKQREKISSAATQTTNYTILFASLGSLVVLSLAGYALTRSIAKPLQEITVAAEKIASGDLNVAIGVNDRSDEVGILARAFGDMTQSLSSLIGQVQKSGIQVTTSSTEIAATAKQQQATANEIFSTTTEIGATAKEISATGKELVKAMKSVAEVAEETATLANSGQAGLTRMETTVRQIMEASGSINARLAVLSEKAGNINTVVTTITKVADQTNLLSLNAAIEAEKAGEYGRGFAVVATEIRRLADQTAVATSDIEQMVKEMQSAVSAGVMGMDKFSEEVRRGAEVVGQVSAQLAQIIEKVQTLTPNFETVNEGMQSQSLGAQQISEALAQLGEAAQQTVESLRQSNLAIQQLTEVTAGLQSGVSRFKVET